MGKTKVPITTTQINFPVVFQPSGGKEDVYVMTLVDPSKNIFTATKVSDKSLYNFKPTDQVIVIDDVPNYTPSALGAILLAIKV